MNRAVSALTVAASLAAFSGCGVANVQTWRLPGGAGGGAGAYEITVELPDVGTLVENADVKVGDVAVGTVTHLKVQDWHATATVSLRKQEHLSSSTTAKVGYNSLLGAAYLELTPPAREGGAVLRAGDAIPLEQSGRYPSTEEVLASASVVLNGSGLQQLRTVTVELKRALATDRGSGVGDLLPRLNSFVGAVDAQRSDITHAIDRLGRLSHDFADDMPVVDRGLDALEPALAVLARERPRLVRALRSLDRLGQVSVRAVRLAKDDLRAVLTDLEPALAALQQSGDHLVGGLRYLFSPPFAPETVPNACRGDYCNLFLTLDVSLQGLTNLLQEAATGDGASAGSSGGTTSPLPQLLPGLPPVSDLGSLLDSSSPTSPLSGLTGLLGGRSTP